MYRFIDISIDKDVGLSLYTGIDIIDVDIDTHNGIIL